MPLTITARNDAPAATDAQLLAVGRARGEELDDALRALDSAIGGAMSRLLGQREFRGDRDELLHLAGSADGGPRRILLVGLGEAPDRAAAIRRGATLAGRHARKLGVTSVAWYHGGGEGAEQAATGLLIGSWEYSELRTPPPERDRRPELAEGIVLTTDGAAVDAGSAIGEGINLARRLGMMPGNLCTPDLLADTAREIGARHGMTVEVMGRAEMEREKLGSLLAVAQGTPQDPKLIALRYRGPGSDGAKPIVLVGKGLCFDSGGISIKPSQGMEMMKFDMSGAGGVLGAMEAIGRMQLPVSVTALIGATTNMPSGTAVKPGDVVRSHLGKTIEVINTDAEGRMVLADVLSWARRYDPSVVIDAATLTGAVVIALGHTAIGVFGEDDALVAEVLAAGRRAGEPGWRLPLWEEYRELIKSDVADMKNAGGRAAGSVSAAMFLREFTAEYPWIHLDVAGTAYSETDLGHVPKGPTGIPTGLFVEFVRARAMRA